ncbi:hypothetical protein ALT761_01147 [Alteromonas sp. 76-1]|jgi:hypothetical protein|uniref:DUF6515 family protein n=1 Tax=Alteromonas sp. 76-1 TaxID=2358187 RepID=UPI000FD17F25|nr:DUF6515 family protein [Alteromonas sp. 76-1]VEL96180.1 hypothetical protein ALT761_01147 [Alteromonas sp. 76-1]
MNLLTNLRFIPIVCSVTLLSACAVPLHGGGARGGFHGGNAALSIGAGIAAGVAVAVLASPRYEPGHRVKHLPKDAAFIRHRGIDYRYRNGVYYRKMGGDFTVVLPPPGVIIHTLPDHPDTIFVDGETYYVVEGVYYKRIDGEYIVVKAPVEWPRSETSEYEAGKRYEVLPEDAQPVKVHGTQYFLYGGLYFLPQSSEGKVSYLAVRLN